MELRLAGPSTCFLMAGDWMGELEIDELRFLRHGLFLNKALIVGVLAPPSGFASSFSFMRLTTFSPLKAFA